MVNLEVQNFEENKKTYNKIYEDLRKDLDETIPINHVGSTVIPNMVGKNIIDILIGAKDNNQFNNIIQLIIDKDFIPSTKSKTDIYQFFASREGETSSGDVHIHVVVMETERYNEFLILRDYLLSNEEEALNYSNLKKDIINSGIVERKQYKTIKSEYVTKLIERAKIWYSIKIK